MFRDGAKRWMKRARFWWGVGRICVIYMCLKMRDMLNPSVIAEGGGWYTIRYILNDRVYQIRTRYRRGPSRIERAEDERGEDVTERLRSLMGPNEDFHGGSWMVQDLGWESLKVIMRGGEEELVWDREDRIPGGDDMRLIAAMRRKKKDLNE